MRLWECVREEYAPKPILLGLERVSLVWDRLGRRRPPTVVAIGGTNGKGSVCIMLDAILRQDGYRVGTYLSPHLISFHERILVNGTCVSDDELDAAFAYVRACEGADALTQFEIDTLAAIEILNNACVNVAILEVGLGGRLDAVNVFDSDCAVVTSVGIDHTDYLGSTREQIAFEKAGIFRGGKVAICADADLPLAIRAQALEVGAELWCIGSEFSYIPHEGHWEFHGMHGSRETLPYPALCGMFQLRNASAALAVLDALRQHLPVSTSAVQRGLSGVSLPGRFQVVPGRPTLVLDVAHNPDAARTLAENIANLPPCSRTIAVFAMLKDKDMAGVVRALKDQVDVWLVGGISAPRGASAVELAAVLDAIGVKGEVLIFTTVGNAWSHGTTIARGDDRIVVFGSFHTVGDVMVELHRLSGKLPVSWAPH